MKGGLPVEVFPGNAAAVELAKSTHIESRRNLLPGKDSKLDRQAFLYNVVVPGFEPTEMVFIPAPVPEHDNPKRLPAWARKEVKKDKHAWRKIHHTLRRTPQWLPAYFEPIPEVESYHPTPM
jgi:hypothetical protein